MTSTGSSKLAVDELASGNEKLLGHLAMILFAALISGSFSLGSMAMPHVGAAALNAMRFLLASLVMAAVALAFYRRLPLPKQAPWRFGVLGLLMGIYFVAMFTALIYTSPVSTSAVFTLIPMMSAGFGYLFLRQTTRPIVIVSLLIAGCGSIWVIFRGDINAILDFDIGIGETIFFFGCICHAAYVPLVKKLSWGEPVILTTFWTTVATFLAIALYGAGEVFATDWTSLPPIVWISICYLAVFTSAGTFFLVQFASLRLPASKVLSYGYLIPVIVIFYEGLLGHGWTNLLVLAGALVTVLGLLIVAFAPDR
jgi:drug/metabolite transporter (DMT)-like permease